ncbi:MAG: S8 family serine peptidase [Candidatus Eisenbacteria bacterium]|nr:S8 family serine peptidase [Candidatus Eisenbacteria bacterium]
MSRRQALSHRLNTLAFSILVILVGSFTVLPVLNRAWPENSGPANVLIIRFEPDIISFPQEIDHGHNHFTLPVESAEFTQPSLETSLGNFGVLTFETLVPAWRHLTEEDLHDRHGNRVDLVDFTHVYRVTFDESQVPTDGDAFVDQLQELPGIAYVGRNQHYELFSTPLQDSFPDDSLFSEQWALHNTGQTVGGTECDSYYDINAPEAWQLWDSPGTKIGIMDQGIYADHEDLKDYIDRGLSKSFHPVNDWDELGASEVHGTQVAGVAAAGANNMKGVASVANLVEDSVIVALKIGEPYEGGGPDTVAARVYRALSHVTGKGVYPKVLVVNQSGGTYNYKNCYSYDPLLRDACRNAFLKDVNLVISAGNSRDNCDFIEDPCGTDTCVTYPAAFDDYCLAVTGIRCNGDLMDEDDQNFGSFIDLAAPGWKVKTTTYVEDEPASYVDFTGTSAAAPHASGAIALLLGVDSSLTNEDCYQLLRLSTAPLDDPAIEVGHGLLRVDSALAAVTYPSAVVRDSVFATWNNPELIDSRDQWFRNLKWQRTEDWTLYWVEVYRLRVTAFLWDEDYAAIDTLWVRGKFTEGAKDLADPAKYDAKFHAGYASLVDSTFDGEKADLITYVYKIFREEGGDSLGWFPQDPAEDIRIDYSVFLRFKVGQGKSAELQAGVAFFGPERLPATGDVVMRLRLARPGAYTLDIYDVAGRRVRELLGAKRLEAGQHRLVWDGRDSGGRAVASGFYFARLRGIDPATRDRVRTSRILLLR